jgi:hypothetical protein
VEKCSLIRIYANCNQTQADKLWVWLQFAS